MHGANETIIKCLQASGEEEQLRSLLDFIKEGHFSSKVVVSHIADNNLVPADILSKLLSDTELFGYKPRPIKTILITVANLHYGGGSQSAASLANYLSSEKDCCDKPIYKVILVSDERPSPKDYELYPSVTRLSIAPRNKKESYKDRADFLYGLITEEHIDLVIQATIRDNDSLWDMLLCKSHPSRPAYIQICRTSFGSLFSNATDGNFKRRKRLYQHADALVVLNNVDRICWGAYSPNVWTIPNIIDIAPSLPRDTAHSHRVVWAGRITPQKQPFELIKVAKKASELLPDIRFDMIGEADDESYNNKLKSEIEKQGLENHVFLLGHHTDMAEQYSNDDIFVHTALYEGFCRVIYEAAAHALPIVMYKIPGLDYKEHLPEIIECNQKEYEQMAHEIVDLLTNHNKYAETSAAIVNQLTSFQNWNQIKEWQRLFNYLEKCDKAPREYGKDEVNQAVDSLVFYHYEKLQRTASRTTSAQGKRNIKKVLKAFLISIRGVHSLLHKKSK